MCRKTRILTQTVKSESHLDTQTTAASCGIEKVQPTQRCNGRGALACMLGGLSSCDEIWFGQSFDITRQ